MRFLKPTASDDSRFVEWVDGLIHVLVERTQPAQLYLVKVDNWFGKRWLRFSGKAVGALGVSKSELTMPPFIPSRIVSQERFSERGSTQPHRDLHRYQRSGENLNRRLEDILPTSSTLFWYSDRSRENRRASLMAYVWNGDEYWTWYIEVACATSWRIVDYAGITKTQIVELEKASGFETKAR
jgi:hypothetical protein